MEYLKPASHMHAWKEILNSNNYFWITSGGFPRILRIFPPPNFHHRIIPAIRYFSVLGKRSQWVREVSLYTAKPLGSSPNASFKWHTYPGSWLRGGVGKRVLPPIALIPCLHKSLSMARNLLHYLLIIMLVCQYIRPCMYVMLCRIDVHYYYYYYLRWAVNSGPPSVVMVSDLVSNTYTL